MFRLRRHFSPDSLLRSDLYDQDTFYARFLKDLGTARLSVVIESPFITSRRMNLLLPTLRTMTRRGVTVCINTRDPAEHSPHYMMQAMSAITELQSLGATVLFTTKHHRKLAIIDDQIIWEGSLNILSQNNSCEMMRRTHSEQLANQMIAFIHLEKFRG